MKKKYNPAEQEKKSSSIATSFFYFSAAFALVYGVVTAYTMRWLCDDIFITFRYVQNWINGVGIVYNAVERVEGYTHFLWMCLIAFFELLGSKPEEISELLGIIFFAGTLFLFIMISWKITPRKSLFLPLTAVMLALNYDFRIWATSGLETSMFTFLISATLWSLCVWKTKPERALMISGLLFVLAMMTRPDGIVIFAAACVFVACRSLINGDNRKQLLRTMLIFGSTFIVIYLPYLIWKYIYYGDILPNTYYAKSGGLSYYSQGFFYIWVYLKSYISSFLSLLGFAVVFLTMKNTSIWKDRLRSFFLQPSNAIIMLALAYLFIYGFFFIVRVGGDFMYARFLHPMIPMMYVVGELSLQKLLYAKRRYLQIVFLVLPLLVVYEKSRRDSLFIEDNGKRKDAFQVSGITDEYWYWTEKESGPVNNIQANEIFGQYLDNIFRGERVNVLLKGQASLGYYGNFFLCIENAGLTDSYIAHLPLENRGRPGHEKNAPVDYLLKRSIHFVFFRTPYDTATYRRISFHIGGAHAWGEMFFYDAQLMKNLRARYPQNVVFTDFQRYLDDY
ncbi:MAG: hypothetical protein WAV76_02385, partial [Bacteroidota bacterium]